MGVISENVLILQTAPIAYLVFISADSNLSNGEPKSPNYNTEVIYRSHIIKSGKSRLHSVHFCVCIVHFSEKVTTGLEYRHSNLSNVVTDIHIECSNGYAIVYAS